VKLQVTEPGVPQCQEKGEVRDDHSPDTPAGEVGGEVDKRRDHLLGDGGRVERQVHRNVANSGGKQERVQFFQGGDIGLLVSPPVAGDDRPERLRPERGNVPRVQFLRPGGNQLRHLGRAVGGGKNQHRPPPPKNRDVPKIFNGSRKEDAFNVFTTLSAILFIM
jgi:hypothetical protein